MGNREKYSKNKPYKVVAFFASNFAGDEQARNISAAHKLSKEYGCRVIFFSTISDFYFDDVNDSGEKKVFDCAAVERFDAVIVMSESFKQDEDMIAMVKRAREAGVPVLAVDKRLENCINLRYDYGDSFKDIVKHMVEDHGYKKVYFMGGAPGNSYSDERLKACRDVLEANGASLPDSRVYDGGFWEEPTEAAMDQMMQNPEGLPEAIVCANDSMALAVISYLKKRGIRVPEDVAVSGFDGIVMEQYSIPRLTTAIANHEGMFRKLFEIIASGNETIAAEPIFIENQVQIGGSCGCHKLNSIDPGEELLKLKNQVYTSARFHEYMNQMVMNLGAEVDQAKVVTEMPSYIGLLNYKHLWRCMNTDYCKYMKGNKDSLNLNSKVKDGIFTDRLSVMQYDQEGHMTLPISMDREDLLIGLEEVLDGEDAVMIVPLHLRGEIIGYLGASFDVDLFAFNLYSSFIVNYRYLFETQRSRVEMQDVYMRDSLSGLLNRNGFYQTISRMMDKNADKEMAVIFMDMDMLKHINDTFGHAEGDSALKFLSTIIKSQLQENDIASRIGGDEFVIAFSDEDVDDRADEIVTRIKETLKRYNDRNERPYSLQVSIGAYCNRIKGRTLDHFLKKADDLMYADKYLHRKENGII